MRVSFAAVVCLALAPDVWAQDADPDIAIAAATNQQGLIEYCIVEGHASPDTAQAQARVIASFPTPTNPTLSAEAYRKGQSGILSAMGMEKPLTDAAREQGVTLADLCQQLAIAADQAAAQLP